MERKRLLGWLWIFIIFAGLSGAGWATPRLGVSGRLLDASGNPIRYYEGTGPSRHEVTVNLTSQLKFYDSETGQTPMHTLATTAEAMGGYFSIYFTLPGPVLLKDQIYYTLAIDADRNGLTSNDLFTGRFQIGAVPFALSAQPSHNFTTHGGKVGSGYGYGRPGHPEDLLVMKVAPFETPSGAVEFNKMNILVGMVPAGTKFTFGIYDEQGQIVVSSGLISVKDVSITNAYLDVKLSQTIKLEPAKIYYTGYASSNVSFDVPTGNTPVSPVIGDIPLSTNNGSIPNSFNPSTLVSNSYTNALPITLTHVPSAPAPARQGVDATKPQIRWIYTKQSKVVKAESKTGWEIKRISETGSIDAIS